MLIRGGIIYTMWRTIAWVVGFRGQCGVDRIFAYALAGCSANPAPATLRGADYTGATLPGGCDPPCLCGVCPPRQVKGRILPPATFRRPCRGGYSGTDGA
jgi:hypothetical protein